jgi:hypothetical protein
VDSRTVRFSRAVGCALLLNSTVRVRAGAPFAPTCAGVRYDSSSALHSGSVSPVLAVAAPNVAPPSVEVE